MLLKLFLTLSVVTSYVVADGASSCILPPYPVHGSYKVANQPNAEPGEAFEYVHLIVTCSPRYVIVGQHNASCFQGMWSNGLPKCERACQLNHDPSITYECLVDDQVRNTRRCSNQEPDGTVVMPKCTPYYYSSIPLSNMKCINGSWDYVAVCQAECGRVAPQGEQLKRSIPAHRGQMPWHAAIYSKRSKPYRQICGGSLISSTIVISAAHCFWSDVDKLKPVSDYAVAVGNEYQPWDDLHDDIVQKSDVKEIKIPSRFRGALANFQEDISLVIVTSPFSYSMHVRPVCLDFDYNFDRKQLESGTGVKVSGWKLGEKTKRVQVIDLKSIDVDTCFSKVPAEFREYITSDKICAEVLDDKIICRGYGGAGAVVPETDHRQVRYYLRGVVSTAPVGDDGQCHLSLVALTHVLKHEHFIKTHLE